MRFREFIDPDAYFLFRAWRLFRRAPKALAGLKCLRCRDTGRIVADDGGGYSYIDTCPCRRPALPTPKYPPRAPVRVEGDISLDDKALVQLELNRTRQIPEYVLAEGVVVKVTPVPDRASVWCSCPETAKPKSSRLLDMAMGKNEQLELPL